jgi:hypothetical protein
MLAHAGHIHWQAAQRVARACKACAAPRFAARAPTSTPPPPRRWNNPTFLDKMVAHFELEPYGTCFRQEVWDPKALPEGDTWPK